MGNRITNAVARRYACDHPDCFSNEHGELMDFGAWVATVLSGIGLASAWMG